MSAATAREVDGNERVMRAARRFGVASFRPGQAELIDAALAGRDAIGVLPTGGGKSLCYQLPALLLNKPTVIVSPLIALVQDQVAHLDRWHLESSRLDSSLTARDERHNEDEIRTGISPLIYVTPERLQTEDCIALLRRNGVARLVVDEAHCVSDWGHDFRPAYLAIAEAARKLGRPPILALTATATEETCRDIETQLGMRAPVRVRPGTARRNLAYRVVRAPSDDRKREALRAITSKDCGIVYCATIAAAEEVHEFLAHEGIETGLYHGKRGIRDREETQSRFMDGSLRVMVATKAFGLGVDKPNIRFVAHWSVPDSLESYVQEAGRAGRDGARATAHLLFRLEDRRVQDWFLAGKYPRREEAQRLWLTLSKGRVPIVAAAEAAGMPLRRARVVLSLLERDGLLELRGRDAVPLDGPGIARSVAAIVQGYTARRTRDRARLDAMMTYASHVECRAAQIARYFGEPFVSCAGCDVCQPDHDDPRGG
jgi:ATP-dependent DNA helicase RecQ